MSRIASGIRAYNQKVYMPESTKSWEEVEVLSRDKTKVLVVDDAQDWAICSPFSRWAFDLAMDLGASVPPVKI